MGSVRVKCGYHKKNIFYGENLTRILVSIFHIAAPPLSFLNVHYYIFDYENYNNDGPQFHRMVDWTRWLMN